jgi:hypothetical protein
MSTHTREPPAPDSDVQRDSQAQTRQQLPSEAEVDWGDPFSSPKPNQTTRIAFTNLGGIPMNLHSPQNDEIQRFLCENAVDVFLNVENNIAWHRIPSDLQLHSRTKEGVQKLHLSIGSLQLPSGTNRQQFGGTTVWSINEITPRIHTSRHDKWGRWSWTVYRGKSRDIVMVAAYRPVLNKTGVLSTWSLLRVAMAQELDNQEPRQAFLQDLSIQITQWQTEGYSIIVALDLNEAIANTRNKTYWQEQGLINVLERHGDLPSTTLRGSYAIDAIYASPDLADVGTTGMLSWEKSCGADGHRVLWWDLPTEFLFGNANTALRSHAIRRLQVKDPLTVQNYLQFVKSHYRSVNMEDRVQSLAHQMQDNGPTAALVQEWEQLDTIRVKTLLEGEQLCRQLKMDQVPWIPELQKFGRKLDFYATLKR